MTEKRFRSHIDECGVYYYIYDKKKILAEAFYKDDAEEIVDLLNALHNENEQLKQDCTALICHNQEYRKENEQLKKQLKKKEVEPIVKALKERNAPYGYYTNNKAGKEVRELFKSKPLNCTEHWDGEH